MLYIRENKQKLHFDLQNFQFLVQKLVFSALTFQDKS